MNTLQQRSYLIQAQTILNPHRNTNPVEIDQAIHTLVVRLLDKTNLSEKLSSSLIHINESMTKILSKNIKKYAEIMEEMAVLLKPPVLSEEDIKRLYYLLNLTSNHEIELEKINNELDLIKISSDKLKELEIYQSWLHTECLLERELEIASLNYLKAKEAAWMLPPTDQEKELAKLYTEYCQSRQEICSRETTEPLTSIELKNFAKKNQLFQETERKRDNALKEAETLLSKMPVENQNQFKNLWTLLNADTQKWKLFYNTFLLDISRLLGNINFLGPFNIQENPREVELNSRDDGFVHVELTSFNQTDPHYFRPIEQPKPEPSEETRKAFSIVRILHARIKKTEPNLNPLVNNLGKDQIDILLENYTSHLIDKVKQPEDFINFVMNRDEVALEKFLSEGQ